MTLQDDELREQITDEALKRYPVNHTVDDPLGETGEAETDPYGYDETARNAFIAGGEYALSLIKQREEAIKREARIGQLMRVQANNKGEK